MARITIVPDDQVVTVDGEPVWFTYTLDADINAIQWYDTVGTIERREMIDGHSSPTSIEQIDSFSDYEYLLPLREAARAEQEIARCDVKIGYHWDAATETCVKDS